MNQPARHAQFFELHPRNQTESPLAPSHSLAKQALGLENRYPTQYKVEQAELTFSEGAEVSHEVGSLATLAARATRFDGPSIGGLQVGGLQLSRSDVRELPACFPLVDSAGLASIGNIR